jgi:D-threonate/D-erythronate kinase
MAHHTKPGIVAASRILLADDLTGASDAGVQFAKNGLQTTVWLDRDTALQDHESDVAVVDMDSRALQPDVAYERMRRFAERLPFRDPRRIAKKIDSTLRGNVGPELHALLEALPRAFAAVVPAYPKNARTVCDGALLIDGVPVDRTDFARDLISPVLDARVNAHLLDEFVSIPLRLVRAGTSAMAQELRLARREGIRVAVFDAETDEDLQAIAGLDALEGELLWIGSAGILGALEAPQKKRGTASCESSAPRGPVVFLIGSLSSMTQRQIDDFAKNGPGHTERCDPVALLRGTEPGLPARVQSAVMAGKNLLLALDARRERVDSALALGAERGWDAVQTSRSVREAFVEASVALLVNRPDATVVLSGGDVARTFCERHRIRGMRLLAEAAPGIPISRAIGASLCLVTKAGGFGRPQTYRDILATLHSQVVA